MYTAIQLLRLNVGGFNWDLTEEEILEFFDSCDAYWMHNEDPTMPHAQLTSGLCSNGYFNVPEVLQYPGVCEVLADQLRRKLELELTDCFRWVVGSAYSAITFSYEMAKLFKVKHGFAHKGESQQMIWRDGVIRPDESVLQIEELITTEKTLRGVRKAIDEAHGNGNVRFLPVVGCIVHRPASLLEVTDIKIVSLIQREIWKVKAEHCPLCEAGSPRLKPKEHWRELTKKR